MQTMKASLTGFIAILLSQIAVAGGGGAVNSVPCVEIANEILTEKRLELLDQSGAITVQVEYTARDCRNIKGRLHESVSLMVKAEDPGQNMAKDFVFSTLITIGNPWIGQGSMHTVGGAGAMANFCKSEKHKQFVNCTRDYIDDQVTDDSTKIGELRKRSYLISLAGDQIPFVRFSVPTATK